MDTVRNQRVLVVDDSLLARELMVKMLEGLDIEVVTASSGEEAITQFEQQDYALVLLDVMMGGITGIETAKRIREMGHSNSGVPIIFITATNTETSSIFDGYEVGAVDYLLKPVDKFMLCSKVSIFCKINAQREVIQEQLKQIQEKNVELEAQFAEIKALRELVPICAECKNVRDDTGYWHSIEQYFSERSETAFSHSICPECTQKLYPELMKKKAQKND